MTCANCALAVNKYLKKQGAENISVNVINGDVSFVLNDNNPEQIAEGIESLGYKVVAAPGHHGHDHSHAFGAGMLGTNLRRFLFCLPFTALLLLHMFPAVHNSTAFGWIMNPWVQLALTIPPFLVGMIYFGRSAVNSIRNRMPNMNVLITTGAAAAFIYSLIGTLGNMGSDYLFYETAATIITLVFLGNYLEDASIASTQKALKALVKSQKVMANMIAFDGDHKEHIFPIENTQLKVGDLILINTGEQVPVDCKILWGDVLVNEAIITGESIPVSKGKKAQLIGGSIVEQGTAKAQVTAVGSDTVLANILQLVQQAQGEKPPVQQLADRISAIFVPAVLLIALVTLAANWIFLNEFTPALMRSIAVLVIACPCAMGLATPAAIAVGLGRAARNGILFRNAKSLEIFRNIRQVVFDKTGTLTTGSFRIAEYRALGIHDDQFKSIVFSLEKHSAHPLAKSIVRAWSGSREIRWKQVEETKGKGVFAVDTEGNHYSAGSYAIAASVTSDDSHNVYVLQNNQLVGWIDLQDELRPESKAVVQYLHAKGINTILLSGDRYEKTKQLADSLGIREVIAGQTPEQKLEKIAALSAESPTVMVGDGINDAPALAKATVGISMSEASQVAVQSAQVVLMNQGLARLPMALGLGRHTYLTIKQNLFWAFLYNIIAIPVAAFGFLTPMFGALVMGLSDVVLAANSVRLFVKKVE